MQERRILSNKKVTLTSSTTSISNNQPSLSYNYITVYADGSAKQTSYFDSITKPDWVTIYDYSSGQILVYIKSQNGNTSSRSGTIVFKKGSSTLEISVYQAADSVSHRYISSVDLTSMSINLTYSSASYEGVYNFSSYKRYLYSMPAVITMSGTREKSRYYVSGYSEVYDTSSFSGSVSVAANFCIDVRVSDSKVRITPGLVCRYNSSLSSIVPLSSPIKINNVDVAYGIIALGISSYGEASNYSGTYSANIRYFDNNTTNSSTTQRYFDTTTNYTMNYDIDASDPTAVVFKSLSMSFS